MKIQRIRANNFKGFEDLDINLNGKSTVIFGINGTGKSTVLSIVNYIFWNWINRLNPAQGTSFRTFTSDMVRFGTSKMNITTELELDSERFCL